MNRPAFLCGVTAAAMAPAITEAAVPGSALARAATALARENSVAIFNHSLRTFLFAELMAKKHGIQYDREVVFVASILHDMGLAPAHMSAGDRFEVDGANIARKLLADHAITGARADLVWDAIALHDQGGIARYKQPEVMLVNAGVSADFGGGIDQLAHADVVDVLRAAPRTGFIEAFLPAVAAVASKKPNATGNSFVVDVGNRMVPGFHLTNFCDAVKDDPFAGYA